MGYSLRPALPDEVTGDMNWLLSVLLILAPVSSLNSQLPPSKCHDYCRSMLEASSEKVYPDSASSYAFRRPQSRPLVDAHTSFPRRSLLRSSPMILSGAFLVLGVNPLSSFALVKGSAPPPKKVKTERGTCKTIDECEAVGRQREEELFGTTSGDDVNIRKTEKGDRYKDIVVGGGPVATLGSNVTIKYRVLRQGKRSSDGLSGEASPVFSRGYGEDDDTEKDTVNFVLGQENIVPAIDAGIVGMQAGGRRRINVDPRRGWKLPDSLCLRTDSAVSQAISLSVVPGTAVQENDACFAENLLPSPSNYGAKRRMLRRYDEALIVDIELVLLVAKEPGGSQLDSKSPSPSALISETALEGVSSDETSGNGPNEMKITSP